MIADGRRKQLIEKAKELANGLGKFSTPGSGDPVDPSRLAEVLRFVKGNGTKDLPKVLTLLPFSYLRKASQGARPQLEEIKRRVSPLAREISDTEELAYLLAWARRLMTIAEHDGTGRDVRGSSRGDHGRRGGAGGSRRR